jgi:hypothetical protein
VHVPYAWAWRSCRCSFGWPLVFYPVHIVFPGLRHRSGVLDRIRGGASGARRHAPAAAPRNRAPVHGWVIATCVLQGERACWQSRCFTRFVLDGGTPEPQARAMAFAAIVFGNVGLILALAARQAPLLRNAAKAESARSGGSSVGH